MHLVDFAHSELVATGRDGWPVTELRWLVGPINPVIRPNRPLKVHLLRTNYAGLSQPICSAGTVVTTKVTPDPLAHVTCSNCLSRITKGP